MPWSNMISERRMTPIQIAESIHDSGLFSVRDVDAGESPYIYSTGNWGPVYLMVKALPGQRAKFKSLMMQVSLNIAEFYGRNPGFDFVEGNATGGMVPGYQLADYVERILGLREGKIPYAYLRESRKEGGQKELITGIQGKSEIKPGMRALITEELVNFAGTTTIAGKTFRDSGFPADYGVCILDYHHADSKKRLEDNRITLVSAITLPKLLDISEEALWIPKKAADTCREFLADTVEWQLKRGLMVPGGTPENPGTAEKAIARGYKMRQLTAEEAIARGGPAGKIKKGQLVYWAEVN